MSGHQTIVQLLPNAKPAATSLLPSMLCTNPLSSLCCSGFWKMSHVGTVSHAGVLSFNNPPGPQAFMTVLSSRMGPVALRTHDPNERYQL